MRLAARVWRHVPAGAEPLHLGALLRHSEGRWNRRGDYAALYTALTRDGAVAEYRKARRERGSAMDPRELVSIDVELEPILDLTTPGAYEGTAHRASEPVQRALLVQGTPQALEHCRRLADQARKEGFTALLVPSAAATNENNLVIFIDIVAPKFVKLVNGPDREQLRAGAESQGGPGKPSPL